MKKLVAVWLVFTFVFAGISLPARAAGFTDLSQTQRFYDEMMFLEGKGIITGYPDGSFRPNGEVTRAAVAIMVGRAVGLDGKQRETNFKDVGADQTASGYIASAVDKGIILGYPDGTYRPNETVTRGQMAIFLARAFNLTVENDIPFTDVSSSMASYNYIKKIIAENLTQGYEDNTFRPNTKVTRAQFSAFLARALDDQYKVALPNLYPSVIRDVTKIYYYDTAESGTVTFSYAGQYDYWNEWVETDQDGSTYSILEYQDRDGYYLGYPESEYYQQLAFPATLGQSWTTGYDGEYQLSITATNLTMTTPAGTFTEVIEVTDDSGWKEYYAPNIGLIKAASLGGTVAELVKLENR